MSSKKLLVVIILFFAGLGAYGWWWDDTANIIADKYSGLFYDLFPSGTEVAYEIEDQSGFPFRIVHRLTDVTVKVPDYGQVTFEALELIHQPWTKGHMMVRFEGPVVRTGADAQPVWTVTTVKNLASLVGHGSGRMSFDLDMRGISVISKAGGVEIPELQYHAKTTGWFGDPSTEAVTNTVGQLQLF